MSDQPDAGPPPRQHKHEGQYTPSIYPFIPKRRIWNDEYGGQMIFGELVGLNFPYICLTGEEKPHFTRSSIIIQIITSAVIQEAAVRCLFESISRLIFYGSKFDLRSSKFSWLSFFPGFFPQLQDKCQESLGPIDPQVSFAVIIIKIITFDVNAPYNTYSVQIERPGLVSRSR